MKYTFRTPRSKVTVSDDTITVDRINKDNQMVRFTLCETLRPDGVLEASRLARDALRYLRTAYVPGVLL